VRRRVHPSGPVSAQGVQQTAMDMTLPVPESLLVPLLDVAAKVLTKMASTGEAPPALRALVGFDPRRLGSGPARQQLRRAVDGDDAFRDEVVTQFRERPGVADALEKWHVEGAPERVAEAAERSDLPLLASALYAARPKGWTFGLGMIGAAAERERADQEQTDDTTAWEVRLATVEEAQRRADQARDDAHQEVARLEAELRDERAARRTREEGAAHAAEEADRRRRDAETEAEQAVARAATAEARLGRESDRAREAEQELRATRRELHEHVTAEATRRTAADRGDVEPLATGAEEGRRLNARETKPDAGESADATPTVKRTRVPCPPGMLADTTEALDTMIRTRGVLLVVDGYNVSMAGWHDAQPAEQRDRLLRALERLHLRVRCDVVVLFDGADVEGVPAPRRRGVRVVFSEAGEEADPVVVREVVARPKRVPVIVASSDSWVREHAEEEGATVVPSRVLLDVLRH